MQRKHFFFSIVFVLVCFGISLAENTPPAQNKEKTGTIGQSEFRAILNKMEIIQQEIDTLSGRINRPAEPAGFSFACPSDNEKPQTEGQAADKTPQFPPEENCGCGDPSHVHNHNHAHASGANPKFSVNGDLLWNINNSPDIEGDSPFQVRELEFSFQHQLSSAIRADICASLGKEDEEYRLELEEAYLTFSQLPFPIKARAGQTRLPFGKDNAIHRHGLPYADRPEVIEHFFGHEGQKGIGAELSGVIPMGKIHAELTGAAVKALPSESFEENTAGKLSCFGKLRLFSDLSEKTNLEMGYSYLTGYGDPESSCRTSLQGVDLTYRWKPAEKDGRSLMLRGEYLWNRRSAADETVKSKGYYLLGQYQFHRSWYLGARYDYAEFASSGEENRRSYSGILTYAPTESRYYRLQYKNILPNQEEARRSQWLFQINFLIGPHGAHTP